MSVSWQQSYREIIDNRLNWTVVLEKTLESPLDCKESQPVHSEGDQPWDFFGRNDAKAETPVLWPPHVKSWLIGKDSDAGREWRQEEKGTTEDEMAGWHHWLDGRKSGWTPGVGDGHGGLACCDSWGRKESDTTERLNWTEPNWKKSFEKAMAPTPVLLPGKSHGWKSLVGCSLWDCEESDTTERLPFHFSISCIGEGNGNPLQCSCLENPMTGEPSGLRSMGSHRVGHDWRDLST